jgi:hypothetical protein
MEERRAQRRSSGRIQPRVYDYFAKMYANQQDDLRKREAQLAELEENCLADIESMRKKRPSDDERIPWNANLEHSMRTLDSLRAERAKVSQQAALAAQLAAKYRTEAGRPRQAVEGEPPPH